MAHYTQHTVSFDGSTTSSSDGTPRVRLPNPPARVSLPSMPAHWAPSNNHQHHVPAVPPTTVSYDQSFPALGATQPRINIPVNAPMNVQHASNVAQRNSHSFEDQMRRMMLNNDRGQVSHDQPTASGWDYQHGQRIASRPNQPLRRQQYGHLNAGQQPQQHLQAQGSRLAPHLRNPAEGPRTTTVNHFNDRAPNPNRFAQNTMFDRPSPQQKQLYDPLSKGARGGRYNASHSQNVLVSTEAKVGYLDLAAHVVVPEAAMTVEEYDVKDKLRLVLQQICRRAISEHEMSHKKVDFPIHTVELKCFGSMSTTFATKGSDMDLVLISPLSEPDASTPESEIPRVVEKALLEAGFGVRLLTKTRVPIIRFCEKPSPELRELLLKERLKFEEERDAPPSVAKQKSKKIKAVKQEKPDSTVSHEGPLSDYDVNKKLNTEQQEPADKDGSIPSSQSTKSEVIKDKGSQEGNTPTTMGKESNEPALLDKSDDERVRLYRLAIQEGWYEPEERKILIKYMQIVGRRNATDAEKIQARTPLGDLPNVIGRYRPPPEAHPLEFPKSGVGVQCDINFSNHLALHNSLLLKCYSLCDIRVREMVLFVKAWTKKRKINSPYHGTLSSYGFVLMVLHYLINVAQPAVLPNLQQIPAAFDDEMSAKVVELDGHNVRFFRNEVAIENRSRQRTLTGNTETLGSLLQCFFHYYAHQGYQSPVGGFSWSTDVLSLRTIGGLIPKKMKGWTEAKTETVELKGPGPQQTKDIRQRYLFAIEDPFEIEHNIARTVVHNGIVAIRDEFRRAHKLIEHAGMVPGKGMEDLLAEAADRENLQHRAFGPKPRVSQTRRVDMVHKAGQPKQANNVQTAGPVKKVDQVQTLDKKGEHGLATNAARIS